MAFNFTPSANSKKNSSKSFSSFFFFWKRKSTELAPRSIDRFSRFADELVHFGSENKIQFTSEKFCTSSDSLIKLTMNFKIKTRFVPFCPELLRRIRGLEFGFVDLLN